MQESLVFITSSTGTPPQGRNARAQARAEMARLNNPCRAQKGEFRTFSITLGCQEPPKQEDGHRRERKCTKPKLPAKRRSSQQATLPSDRVPLRDNSLLRSAWMAAVSDDLDDVLAIAAYHVRRSAAQMATSTPERLVDALRCRQWSVPPFSVWHMKHTEPIASATALLGIKLRLVLSGKSTDVNALAGSEWAIRSLRVALASSNGSAKQELLPAVWLLALSEMLELPLSDSWTAHAAGAAALIRSGALSKSDPGELSMRFVRPTLVEAFLTGENAMATNAPWQAIIHPVVSDIHSKKYQEEVTGCLTTAAALISEMNHWDVNKLQPGCESLTQKLMPLYRANHARESLKQAVLALDADERPDHDILGLCLAAMVGLDRLMSRLQPVHFGRAKTHEEDTLELCTQVLHSELKQYDANPTTKLMLAFKRHGTLAAMALPE